MASTKISFLRPANIPAGMPWPLPDRLDLSPYEEKDYHSKTHIMGEYQGKYEIAKGTGRDFERVRLLKLNNDYKIYKLPEWFDYIDENHLEYIRYAGNGNPYYPDGLPKVYYSRKSSQQGILELNRPTREATHEEVNTLFSMEESLIVAELEEANAMQKLVNNLRIAIASISRILDVATVKDKDKQAVKENLKTLTKVKGNMKNLDFSNVTLELERDLFIWSLTQAVHHLNFNTDTVEESQAAARKIYDRYWYYCQGDVLSANGVVTQTISFLDPNDEVGTLVEDKNITPQEARLEIMNRALAAVKNNTAGDYTTELQTTDPSRFPTS